MEYLRMVEREDSGIDSDGEGQRRVAAPVYIEEQSSDGSDLDEDMFSKSEKVKQMLDAMAAHEEILRANDRFQYPFIDGPEDCLPEDEVDNIETPDRGSPLYEVELTASDEDDDDGSLIELIIPVLSKRYAKKKPWPVRVFETVFCCVRSSK